MAPELLDYWGTMKGGGVVEIALELVTGNVGLHLAVGYDESRES